MTSCSDTDIDAIIHTISFLELMKLRTDKFRARERNRERRFSSCHERGTKKEL